VIIKQGSVSTPSAAFDSIPLFTVPGYFSSNSATVTFISPPVKSSIAPVKIAALHILL